METNPTPAPRQRNRRADRYRQAEDPQAMEQQAQPLRDGPDEASAPMTQATPVREARAETPIVRRTPVQPVRAEPQPAPVRAVRSERQTAPVQASRSEQPPSAPPLSQPEIPPVTRRTPAQMDPAWQADLPLARSPRRRPEALDHLETASEAPADDKPAVPRWMVACVVALFFLALGLFTAQSLMQAYLVTQEKAREDAHQALLSAHPLGYTAAIDRYADEYGLQPAFVAAIILNESSYRAAAESSIGARGLMQLMPDTAQWIARKLGVADYSFDMLWDPETNIRFGCWYLRYLSELFGGDPVAVTAAYHAGQGTVANWLANRSISPDGRTLQVAALSDGPTKTYAGRVMKAYAIYDALYYHAFDPLLDSSAGAADDAAAGV